MRRSTLLAAACALAFGLGPSQALCSSAKSPTHVAGIKASTAAKLKPKALKTAKPSLSKKRANVAKRITVKTKAKAARRVTLALAPLSVGSLMGLGRVRDELGLESNAVLVMDASGSGLPLFEKNAEARLPIASITKLMTAMVALDASPNLAETLMISEADVDRVKFSSSRLPAGSRLSREEMLRLALMSSENRAAHALSRHYPGGSPAFVAAMNAKAKALGMTQTRYVDPTGLSPLNVSTARDLGKLIVAAHRNPIIRAYSTEKGRSVSLGKRILSYFNTNRLVRDPSAGWSIGLQKTGYIMEAGRCLVMQAVIGGRPVAMVFLDSKGKGDRFEDARRVRQWLASQKGSTPALLQAATPAAIAKASNIALDRPLY